MTLAVASLAAWGFARWSFRGRDALLSLLVSLMVVPPVVLLVPLFVFGAKLGWISTFRLVILIYVGLMLPFSIFMLTSFFRTIPASMIEAATVDGASSFTVFRRIVLPLSGGPARDARRRQSALGLERAADRAGLPPGRLEEDADGRHHRLPEPLQPRMCPAIMAGLTLATLPIVTLYLFGQRFFVRGLVSGAAKGE